MSAHKRALITPDSAALRRIDELAEQLRATSRPDPGLLQAVKRDTQTQIQQAAAHTQTRQEILNHRLNEKLSRVDLRINEIARMTSGSIQNQAYEIQALAQEFADQGQLASQTEFLLEKQSEQFEALVQQAQIGAELAHRQIQEELFQLHQQGFSEQQFHQHARQAAFQALRQVQTYLESLQSTYPSTSELQGFQDMLLLAQQNLESGYSEAALSTTQNTLWQLHHKHLALEHEAIELEFFHTAAIEKAGQVNAFLEGNRVVNAIDLDGRSLDFPLDVDFWTGGGWSRLKEHLDNIRAYLQQESDSLFKNDLVSLLHETLPEFESGVEELVAEARRNILASQLRFNMAEAVMTALSQQGFVPSQASYIEGDMRQAYQLALHNLEGNQLVVTLAPQESSLEHQLDLVSKEKNPLTPHERRQRARELVRSLQRVGLVVHNPVHQGVHEEQSSYQSSHLRPNNSSRVIRAQKHKLSFIPDRARTN